MFLAPLSPRVVINTFNYPHPESFMLLEVERARSFKTQDFMTHLLVRNGFYNNELGCVKCAFCKAVYTYSDAENIIANNNCNKKLNITNAMPFVVEYAQSLLYIEDEIRVRQDVSHPLYQNYSQSGTTPYYNELLTRLRDLQFQAMVRKELPVGLDLNLTASAGEQPFNRLLFSMATKETTPLVFPRTAFVTTFSTQQTNALHNAFGTQQSSAFGTQQTSSGFGAHAFGTQQTGTKDLNVFGKPYVATSTSNSSFGEAMNMPPATITLVINKSEDNNSPFCTIRPITNK